MIKPWFGLEIPLCATIPSRYVTTSTTYSSLKRNRNVTLQTFWIQSKRLESSNVVKEDGYFKKMLKKAFEPQLKRTNIQICGYMHYENIVDVIKYEEWFDICKLSDTFMSWFLVTELHVWLLMVRAMAEGDDGRSLRNAIVESLWNDVSIRTEKIGISSSSSRRKHMEILSQEFRAALVGYDEGICTNDMILAGAVWRRFYKMDCDNCCDIEKVVKFIRKQTLDLEKISKERFFIDPKNNVTWIQLNSLK